MSVAIQTDPQGAPSFDASHLCPAPLEHAADTQTRTPDGRLLTVAELALRLSVPTSWVYSRTARDAMPMRRLGQYVRFDWPEVQAWMRAGCPDPHSAETSAPGAGKASSGLLARRVG